MIQGPLRKTVPSVATRKMERKPGVIKSLQTIKPNDKCAFKSQMSIDRELVVRYCEQSKSLVQRSEEISVREDNMLGQLQKIIANLLRKNEFLCRQNQLLLQENYSLKQLIKDYQQDLLKSQHFTNKMGRAKSKQNRLINSFNGLVDFFSLSRAMSLQKVFIESPYCRNNLQNQNSDPNSVIKAQIPKQYIKAVSKLRTLNRPDDEDESRRQSDKNCQVDNLSAKESFLMMKSGSSGIPIDSSRLSNIPTSIAEEGSNCKPARNESVLIQRQPENNDHDIMRNIRDSRQFYICHESLSPYLNSTLKINNLRQPRTYEDTQNLQIKNCQLIRSLFASRQGNQVQDNLTPKSSHHMDKNREMTSGENLCFSQIDQFVEIEIETPTLDQKVGRLRTGWNGNADPLIKECQEFVCCDRELIHNENSMMCDTIRCESVSQFAPLRCFYLCMLSDRRMIRHFQEVLSELKDSPSDVINDLYKDNRFWVHIADKFVKDYRRGRLYSENPVGKYLLENTSNASSLMGYINENQLIDISMIGILKQRLRFMFSQDANRLPTETEVSPQMREADQIDEDIYRGEEIFMALANEFNLKLLISDNQYRFYLRKEDEISSGEDTYLLASANDCRLERKRSDCTHSLKHKSKRFDNLHGILRQDGYSQYSQLQVEQEEQKTEPLFTINHRKDFQYYQFLLPKMDENMRMREGFDRQSEGLCLNTSRSEEQSISYKLQNSQSCSHYLSQKPVQQSKRVSRKGVFMTEEWHQESEIEFECSQVSQCLLSIKQKSNQSNLSNLRERLDQNIGQQKYSSTSQLRSQINETGTSRQVFRQIRVKQSYSPNYTQIAKKCELELNNLQLTSGRQKKIPHIPKLPLNTIRSERNQNNRKQNKLYGKVVLANSDFVQQNFWSVNLESKNQINSSYSFEMKQNQGF